MRLLLIVNTSASSVTPRGRVVIQKALGADFDVHMVETSRRGHATRLADPCRTRGSAGWLPDRANPGALWGSAHAVKK